MEKENYRVDSPVRHNNIKFAIGDTIALSPNEAAPLLGYKVISRFASIAVMASAAADSIGKTAMALDKALQKPPTPKKPVSQAQKAAIRKELLAAGAKAAKDAKAEKGKAKPDDKKAAAKGTKKEAKEGSDIPERTGSEPATTHVESEASAKNTDFRKSKDGPEG